MLKRILISGVLLALFFNLGWPAKTKDKTPSVERPVEQKQQNQAPSTNLLDKKPETVTTPQPASPDAFNIPWLSINAGGDITMTSTNFGMKASVGQSVIGYATSDSFQMGIGFWYGSGGASGCVAKPGDANASNTYTLGDIISNVNYIFNKPGCVPTPLCWLSNLLCRGDWNGVGGVSLGDIVQSVNYIFNKPGGPWFPISSGVCCIPYNAP